MPSIAGANTAFNALQDAYDRSLRWSMAHQPRHPGSVRRSASLPASSCSTSCRRISCPADDTGQLHGQHPGRKRHLLRAHGRLWHAGRATSSSRSQCRGRHVAGRHRTAPAPTARISPSCSSRCRSASCRADEVARRAAPQGAPISPASMSSSPTRPPSASAAAVALHLSIYAAGPGSRAAAGRFGPVGTQAADHAGLRRRQQRFRPSHAFGAGQDRPRPRRRAGRHASPDRNRDGLRLWRRAGVADLWQPRTSIR